MKNTQFYKFCHKYLMCTYVHVATLAMYVYIIICVHIRMYVCMYVEVCISTQYIEGYDYECVILLSFF